MKITAAVVPVRSAPFETETLDLAAPLADEPLRPAIDRAQKKRSRSEICSPVAGTTTAASSKRGGPNIIRAPLLKAIGSIGMPKKFRSNRELSFLS